MKEKEIENAILQYLSLAYISNGVFFKNQSVGIFDRNKGVFRRPMNRYHIKGSSDILGCVDGRFIAIEVKGAKGRLSLHQKEFLNNINEKGGLAFVARSINDVKTNMEKLNEDKQN